MCSAIRDAREAFYPARVQPGTPMRKVIPPRMVGPYMTGQRGVIAGYVHRVRDIQLRTPAEAYSVLGLGYDGSEFRPDMAEIFFLCWSAREIDGYVPVNGTAPIPEFYLEPIQIPVGTTLCRLTREGDQPAARYDGLAWRRLPAPGRSLGPAGPGEGGVRRALPSDGVLPRNALPGRGRSIGQRGDAVRRLPPG